MAATLLGMRPIIGIGPVDLLSPGAAAEGFSIAQEGQALSVREDAGVAHRAAVRGAGRVTKQTTSPNSHQTLSAEVTGGTSTKSLADKTQTLATGQSISYTFTWP